ncbi:putative arginase protein [Lasiodiplodia theobromae]|uniref:Arginase n=1 Tax=Lasiodiplodia theobromae TaxID=45133 RepID=A0A8H7ITG3_9PEZI|nr:putative arginase protein [Lasiodiplodia theobromae]
MTAAKPPSPSTRRRPVGLTAAAFAGGQAKKGVDRGPAALLAGGLLSQLRNDLGLSVHWDGQLHDYASLIPDNDPDVRGMHRPRAVSAATRALSAQVHAHVVAGRIALTLGGDHSIGIGTVSGVARAVSEGAFGAGKELGVVWVDAHGDINTPATSASGNVHGMPLAFLLGLVEKTGGSDDEDVFGWMGQEHRVSPRKLVYVGLRDLDEAEKRAIQENGIKAYTMRDVERYGIGGVMEMVLAWLGHDTPIHLSFDIDSLDPSFAPSTGFPVWEGLTLREGNFIAETIAATGNLVGLDLVEINPTIAPEEVDKTVRAGCSILRSALGETLL